MREIYSCRTLYHLWYHTCSGYPWYRHLWLSKVGSRFGRIIWKAVSFYIPVEKNHLCKTQCPASSIIHRWKKIMEKVSNSTTLHAFALEECVTGKLMSQ